jgi:hypothetical protein
MMLMIMVNIILFDMPKKTRGCSAGIPLFLLITNSIAKVSKLCKTISNNFLFSHKSILHNPDRSYQDFRPHLWAF